MWFIGVEVEQETSAPPPNKKPGSAPVFVMFNATQQRERRFPALTYHIIYMYVKRHTSTLHFIEIFALFFSVCVINIYLIYGIDMSSKRRDIP